MNIYCNRQTNNFSVAISSCASQFTKKLIKFVVRFATKNLDLRQFINSGGLKRITFECYSSVSNSSSGSYNQDSGTIFINLLKNANSIDLIDTVLHETRHAWQDKNGKLNFSHLEKNYVYGQDENEIDANHYSQIIIAVLLKKMSKTAPILYNEIRQEFNQQIIKGA